jgi:hypothetical protein
MQKLHVLSLGAGVQSSTMALLAAHGEIEPLPDCAIFADTGWEPKHVYEYLNYLTPRLPFPLHIVRQGNIKADLIAGGSTRASRFITAPFFFRGPHGEKGIGRRQCTSHYKVEPIRRKCRELLGAAPRQRIPAGTVVKWLGISVDEIIRATPSKVRWEEKRFPLLERRMDRGDCIGWLTRHGYKVPGKSSCIGCPLRNNTHWKEIKRNRPDEFREACEMDRLIRDPAAGPERGQQYIHSSCKPLDQVDFSTAEDRGQLNLFNEECEGMCGV